MILSEPSDKLYNISAMSFIKVYNKMATSIRFFLSLDFLACTDTLLDMFSTGFSHVMS